MKGAERGNRTQLFTALQKSQGNDQETELSKMPAEVLLRSREVLPRSTLLLQPPSEVGDSLSLSILAVDRRTHHS